MTAIHRTMRLVVPIVAVFGMEAWAEEERRRSTLTPAVIVGHWVEEQEAGEPVLRVDGEDRRTHAREVLEQVAVSLFGAAQPAFLDNALAPGAFSLVSLPEVATFTSGTIRVAFKLVAGASDQTAGIVFGLRPTGEYFCVRYNTREGNVAVWRFADGKRQIVARGDDETQLPLGAWHELVLSIDGTKLSASAAGTVRLEMDLPQRVQGRVGFWTKRDSTTLFSRLQVEPRP